MPTDPHPRYVLTLDGLHVLDRWYCHTEVYRTQIPTNDQGGYKLPPHAHYNARRVCAELNAEHDAWLATG